MILLSFSSLARTSQFTSLLSLACFKVSMDSKVQVPKSETSSVWTNEKHLHFLNTIEASFVRTMLHRYNATTRHLRLDRHLPDTSDSTLDSESRRTLKKHSPYSDSMGPKRRRKLSQLHKAVQQVENERESGSPFLGGNDQTEK